MVTEISVEELAGKLSSQDAFVLFDVREGWELARASIRDERVAAQPMSELAYTGVEGLPGPVQQRDAEILVLCHQGVRSADVAGWLASEGWTRVSSVAGGIDAYARKIDPSVGTY